MTVENTNPIQHFIANGETTVFAISFAVEGKDNIKVTVNGSVVSVNDYSYDTLTKAVVFNAAPEDGAEVVVERVTSLDRSINYQTYNNSFRPETLNYDLDRIWHVLQEKQIVDAETLANLINEVEWRTANDEQIRAEIKQEVEARRTLDLNYDTLAQVRDLQVFSALKQYLDTILSGTSPNVFGGVTAGVVFALDKKSVQTHLEEILNKLVEDRTQIEGMATKSYVDAQLNNKSNVQDVYNKSETFTKSEVINTVTPKADKTYVDTALAALNNGAFKAYPTLSEANADIANIAVNTKVDVLEELNGGSYYKETEASTSLTKSNFDPLTQAKKYTDKVTTFIDSSAFTQQGLVNESGVFLSTTTFRVTDFIKVVAGRTYSIYSRLTGTGSHAWYDENKVFISSFGSTQTTLSEINVVVPENAAYLRVSAYLATAWNVATIKSKVYDIETVKSIVKQHMPNVDANKINYESTTVKETLDTVIEKQSNILANQNNINSQLDLISDKENPYFINTYQYTRSGKTPTNLGIVNVVDRISDTQLNVSDPTAFVVSGACVVFDPTANTYTSHAVTAISGSTITFAPKLPLNPTQVQTMHDSTLGQHLSLFGYKGLADYLVSSLQKYSYKKNDNLLFNFNPAYCALLNWNNSDIYNADASQMVIPVTRIGTATSGGYVATTTNLIRSCAMSHGKDSTYNIGAEPHTQYLSRAYILRDAVANNGFEISFSANNLDGFIELPLAVRDESYISTTDSQTYKTKGKARLQVFNNTTVIFDSVYEAGCLHSIFVDFTNGDLIKVRVTCESSVPTSIALGGIFAYKKSIKTSKETLFESGDVIAFLGDSWTQYPIASDIGEIGQTRPDGSISTGSQWLSRRMQEKLASEGKDVTMLNMGFGGQTSKWGKYWVNTIISLDPKPTHCVICFYINDLNSAANPSNTFYDFDPNNMFLNKSVTNGGVYGRIADENEWKTNIKWLCSKLAANGIKPIVIMPSHTASDSQAQAIRAKQLPKLASGF